MMLVDDCVTSPVEHVISILSQRLCIACLEDTSIHSEVFKSSFAFRLDRCKTSIQNADNDRVHYMHVYVCDSWLL